MQMSPQPHRGIDWVIVGIRAGIVLVLLLALGAVIVAVKNVTGLSWTMCFVGLGLLLLLATVAIVGRAMHRRQPVTPEQLIVETSVTVPESAVIENDDDQEDPTIDLGPILPRNTTPRSQLAENVDTDEPQVCFDPIIYRRHWKGVVRNSAPTVLVAILGTFGISILLANYGRIPPDYRINSLYFVWVELALILFAVYTVFRERYRMQHSPIIVERHMVTIVVPRKLIYGFRGNSLSVPRDGIDTVKLEKKTIMEHLFFKKVQTVTLDTPGTKDEGGHHLQDIIDAKEMSDAIFVWLKVGYIA